MVLPVVMLFLLGMLEFGFAFDHAIGLGYSTREGARAGSAMGEGSASIPCAEVDDYIIAAVQRVLTAPGSQVAISRVEEVTIYDADATTGTPISGRVNVWNYTASPTKSVDGVPLNFNETSVGYSACTTGNRDSGFPADSIGVGIRYRYDFVTPLGAMFNIFGPGVSTLTMSDRTVMAINPGAL